MPRTSRRNRALFVVGIALILVAVLLAVILAVGVPPVRPGEGSPPAIVAPRRLSPSTTERALRARRTPPPSFDEADDPVEDEPVVVTVMMSSRRTAGLELALLNFEPRDWFPTADEMGVDDLQTAELLDEVLADSFGPSGLLNAEDAAELLASAEEESLTLDDLQDDTDPWERLLAIHIAQVASTAEYKVQNRAALDVSRAAGPFELPLADRRAELDEALALVQEHPEHEASEFAWLYILHALGDPRSNTRDSEQLRPLTLDLMQTTQDDVVRDAAARHLASVASNASPLSPSELQALDRELDSLVTAAPDVAFYLLSQAQATDDPARIEGALTRYEDVVEQLCPTVPGQLNLTDMLCVNHWGNVWRVRAPLLTDGIIAPSTWGLAIEQAVRQCDPSGESVVLGSFDGQWAWSAESGADELLRCLTAATPLPVQPEEPLSARVRVIRSRM